MTQQLINMEFARHPDGGFWLGEIRFFECEYLGEDDDRTCDVCGKGFEILGNPDEGEFATVLYHSDSDNIICDRCAMGYGPKQAN